ncbi:MAG: carboxypeptidase-like regulatory domain-containing protein, partial [candidate division WOR-3 bacterium]
KLIKISGRVADFSNQSIANAEVEIKGGKFKTIYETKSDKNGRYEIMVRPGNYLAIMACKDYGTKNLEYWAWNVPAYKNLEINPKIDGLEVYAMNAFIPQTPIRSVMVYFRPMSLKRVKEQGGIDVVKQMRSIDIAPNLSKEDIDVRINEHKADLLVLNRVKESIGNNRTIISYLIQCSLPKEITKAKYLRIDLTIYDRKTKENGEGCLFLKIGE